MMEHRDLQFRFDPASTGEFSGYAARFDEATAHGEIVSRGAFRKTLSEHRAAGTRPLMLWMHDPAEVVGVWSDIREDDRGLAVTGRIITDTRRGQEALVLLKAGALNGLSIGFRVRAAKRGRDGIQTLTDVDLAEISIVGLPSAGGARITSVRAQPDRLASFAQACRQARCALITSKDKA